MRRLCVLALAWGLLSCEGTPRAPQAEKQPATVAAKEANAPDAPSVGAGVDENELRLLAQSTSTEGREKLRRYLTASPNARRWGAFALGLHCARENSKESVSTLVNAVAVWMSESKPVSPSLLQTAAWAIGACAAPESEEILRSWLAADGHADKTGLLEAALFGLGAFADRQGSLSERTQTLILDTAAREGRSELLLPLGRIGRLSEAVGAHILEVTGSLLTRDQSAGRRHAIFALGSAGPSAAAPLSQILLSDTFSPQERAAAAQALGRLGEAGQQALDETVRDMLERGLPLEYDRPLWMPLRAATEALERPEKSRAELGKLATVVLSDGPERKKDAQRRRMIWLRCRAAELLAKKNFESAPLLACDPEKGRDFRLAQLQVVGRDKFTGKRLKKFLEFLTDKDPVLVQAALRMLPQHTELKDTDALLLRALNSTSPGTQATAAQVIGAYPSRAKKNEDDPAPNEQVVAVLQKLLTSTEKRAPAETRASAIKAAGAIGALSLKAALEALCSGAEESTWDPTERALSLLGSPDQHCPAKRPALDTTLRRGPEPVTLVIDSDVGELLLHVNGTDAPVSATHFLSLVDAGFYNGLAVHGSRAGFAVQFGDRDGDGYQDGPTTPLPHEVSPDPFAAFTFGMTAFSPGSQDAQIFVVVSDAPQLTGSRVLLGRAEGPWQLVAPGDVFHSVKRLKKP